MLRTLLKILTGKPAFPPAITIANIPTPEDAIDTQTASESEPQYRNQVGPSSSWIEHAYPLKQLVIEIRSSGPTASLDAIHSLQTIHHEVSNGQDSGEVTLPTLEFTFSYQDKVPFLSFFVDAAGKYSKSYAPSNDAAEGTVQLIVKLQGIRHTERARVVSFIAPVIEELKAGAHIGLDHDDDVGYMFELSRLRGEPLTLCTPAG